MVAELDQAAAEGPETLSCQHLRAVPKPGGPSTHALPSRCSSVRFGSSAVEKFEKEAHPII